MSPVERIRLNESGWRSPVEWVWLNESGWRVRLNESGWMSPVEWVWLNESSERVRLNDGIVTGYTDCGPRPRTTLPADRSVRRTQWLWITPSKYHTDCGSQSIISSADPSVGDHIDCGSQRSADPLTVDHIVRVSHRLRITADDDSHWSFLWWSHRLRIAAFGGPTDCGSHRPRIAQTVYHSRWWSPIRWWSLPPILPLMITLADFLRVVNISLRCWFIWHRLRHWPRS